jgi:hypothetical protein
MRIWTASLGFIAALIVSAAGQAADCADPQFDAFWAKFKTAIAKNDKQAVVSMTKTPYMLDGKMLNKQQLLAKYNLLFPKGTAQCFKKEKPLHDQGVYEVFCGEQIYIFSRVNGKWMFTEIGVND